MTNAPRVILCDEATSDKRTGNGVLRLRSRGRGRDVHLQVEDVNRSLATVVPPQFADLIEIATYVYVADQAHARGGDGVEDMGANWRRPLHFEIPVRCAGLWQGSDVGAALQDLLSFLSEDEYTFTFRAYENPPSATGYFKFASTFYEAAPERVILFSGGLDSLGGAVQEVVVEGRPVVLVTHQATAKFVNRLRTLRQLLDGRARGPTPMHVTVRINKKEHLSREYTQRSRSFLYASLGATIARIGGLDEVRFYENGTVSLNLPISRQVVGSKATRTTHPRVLSDFARLFSLIGDRPFSVVNHYLWKTKGEVVKSIVDAGCGGLIEWSSSCTHTWELSNAKPHCGKCSQCIDRRFAVLAAGAGQFERADTYAVDLLVDPRDVGEPRTMLASYIETAQQVATISEVDFFMRYGEAARIVRQLGGSADENARKVYHLHRRHAQEVIRVVETGLGQNVSRILARSLPESCLLRLVHDPSVPAGPSTQYSPTTAVPAEPNYFLRRRGQAWEIRFAGHEPQSLLPSIGYAYLRELLGFPNKSFTVSELLVAIHGDKAMVPRGDGDEDFDAQAKRAYAQRLHELEEEVTDARERGNVTLQYELMAQREKLLTHLRGAAFRGKAKRSKSDLNRVRNSVGNAIRRALATIEKYEPDAFEHLKKSISLGFSIAYRPSEEVSWSF